MNVEMLKEMVRLKDERIKDKERIIKASCYYINRFNNIDKSYNFNYKKWKYGSQWCILNRTHVGVILKNEKRFEKIFSTSKFPDEYAYINFLLENKQSDIKNLKTTFHNFLEPSTNKKHRKYPKTYETISDDYLISLKKSFFFMRKVTDTTKFNKHIIFNDLSSNLKDIFSESNKLEHFSENINKSQNNRVLSLLTAILLALLLASIIFP
jgi:hypothetical protein